MSRSSKSNAEPAADRAGDEAETCAELSFELALKRLEELVRRLEQGNVPLDQSLAEYTEAVELLRTCQTRLDEAQVRIEVLSGFDSDGNPVVRPLANQAGKSLEEKRQARSSRRSAESPTSAPRTSRKASDVDDSGQLF